MQRFRPPPPTPESRAADERARKHFVFAMILVLGIVFLLPVLGAVAYWLGFFEPPT